MASSFPPAPSQAAPPPTPPATAAAPNPAREAAPFFAQQSDQSSTSANDLHQLRSEDDSVSAAMPAPLPTFPPGYTIPIEPRQPTSPERVAQGVLSIDDHHQHLPESDAQNSAKRRSKISRACDECRRKKVRCDATSDSGPEPCTNCKRSGLLCQFSRQPMKRGPSKGYIKELAERLHSLESQMGPQGQQTPYPPHLTQSMDAAAISDPAAFYPQESPTGTRKRKLSGIGPGQARDSVDHESLHVPPQAQNHQYPHPRPAAPDAFNHAATGGLDFSAAAAISPSLQNNQFARQEALALAARRDTVGEPFEEDGREPDGAQSLEMDEGILDEYYRLIHQTFPLLPHSKTRLRSRLLRCPGNLQEAFLLALDSAIRSYPSSNFQATVDSSSNVKKSTSLLSNYQFEPASSRSISSNLTYIQTLVLLTLESDNHGPATMRGLSGPPRAEWLGRAIGMATHLKLNTIMPRNEYGEGDPDGDEKMGRRIWWVLFILDRWHASSTSSLLQLPENGTTILVEDQILLGTPTWNLVRLSHILGHLSQILQQPPSLMSPTSPAAGIITTTILGEIDRFRESVESVLLAAPNLVHLCYWHVRLMVMRLTSSTTPHELLAPAMRMASALNSSYTTITPLNHHFAALSAMTLCELADFDETKEGAQKGIEDIIDALGTRRGFSLNDDSAGWDSAIRELVMKRRGPAPGAGAEDRNTGASTGLQHLADAAIGDRGAATPGASSRSAESPAVGPRTSDGSVGSVFDPTLMTRYGYLAALVQENAA